MTKKQLDVERYRVHPGSFRLSSIDPSEVQGWEEEEAEDRADDYRDEIEDLQERLYAEGEQSVLLVFQAIDAGGKDSTIRKLMSGINPQGCRVASFKAPSAEELSHDFLWRIHNEAPRKGMIRIFNRSHYEDVLIVRVNGWAPVELTEKRYGHINDFERLLSDHGTRMIKIMLYISPEYQMRRFRRRLERPDKWWKFNPADLDTRSQWGDLMNAYEMALNRCSTDYAPWYCVPAEHKYFRVLVVSKLLRNLLRDMEPQFPAPDFDPNEWTPEKLDEIARNEQF